MSNPTTMIEVSRGLGNLEGISSYASWKSELRLKSHLLGHFSRMTSAEMTIGLADQNATVPSRVGKQSWFT